MENNCKKEFNFEEPVYLTVWITVYVKTIFKQPKHKQNARCKKSQAVLFNRCCEHASNTLSSGNVFMKKGGCFWCN